MQNQIFLLEYLPLTVMLAALMNKHLVTSRVAAMKNLFGFSLAADAAKPPSRQAAKPPSRQAAKPPSRQAAKPPSRQAA
ncbi:MAG: hypothetical protein LBK71_07705, partial [Verrucomicrobiales bacterium]|nr:hypothetical protein [Verrucomicrobiales bacterium]